jgi:serine/threonine-protein kinase
VSARFLAGVGAWLLGAAAATGGSLIAVSALGQGLTPTPSQQLTVAAVNQALASEPAETAPPPPAMPPVSSSATPLAPRPRKRSPAPSVSPSSPAPQPATTNLGSVGGSVVARCQPAGAYLVWWSPAQGYENSGYIRGPAPTVKVTFEGSRKLVTMVVSCSGGVPAASTTVSHDT